MKLPILKCLNSSICSDHSTIYSTLNGYKNGFHFITVDQLIRAHQGKFQLPTKPVLLTVDDGYQSFYQNAYPVIKAKNPCSTCSSRFMVRAKSRAESRFFREEIPRDKILSWVS